MMRLVFNKLYIIQITLEIERYDYGVIMFIFLQFFPHLYLLITLYLIN